jgi:hypothetical protein
MSKLWLGLVAAALIALGAAPAVAALTQNALTQNALAASGSSLAAFNGVVVESVILPATH